jgi:hypothetical protein
MCLLAPEGCDEDSLHSELDFVRSTERLERPTDPMGPQPTGHTAALPTEKPDPRLILTSIPTGPADALPSLKSLTDSSRVAY